MKFVLVLVALAGCHACADTYPVGVCDHGASVYNGQIKLCSYSGIEPDDGICMQRSHTPVCFPLCHPSGDRCDPGVQMFIFNGLCYCDAPL